MKKSLTLLVLILLILGLLYFFVSSGQSPALSSESVTAPQEEFQETEDIQVEEATPEYEKVNTGIISDTEAENKQVPFPPIWGTYSSTLGFDSYARAMEARGCVLFFYSKKDNLWRKINYSNSSLENFDPQDIISGKKWGTKPANISNEPMLKRFLANESATTDIFFAKPISMENKIESTIRAKISQNAIKLKDVVSMRGSYSMQGSMLFLNINSLVFKNGNSKKFICSVEL